MEIGASYRIRTDDRRFTKPDTRQTANLTSTFVSKRRNSPALFSRTPQPKDTMTIQEILAWLEPYKSMTRVTLYTHMRKLRIRPISRVRQRPQLYPSDTPARVLSRLGIKTKPR